MRRLFLFAPLLLLYCTLVTLAVTEHHRCIHDRVMMHVGAEFNGDDCLLGMTTESRRRDPKESADSFEPKKAKLPIRKDPQEGWEPIRIKLVSDHLKEGAHHCSDGVSTIKFFLKDNFTCKEDDILTAEKKKILVDEILPEAIKLHKERLFVKRLNGSIVVPNFSDENLCSKFIPEEYKDKTRNFSGYDMVLFAAAAPTPKGTFAWAATCATLGRNGRPVIGIINYGPRYIVATPQRVRVAAHEIAHALGFDLEVMESKSMVRRGVTLREKTIISLVTSDNTRRETMKHYKCDSAKGMELQRLVIEQKSKEEKGPLSGTSSVVSSQSAPTPHSAQAAAILAQVASVQEEYELGESHSNVIDGRLTAKESVDSVVQERREEEGSSDAKFTQNVHHSSNVFSKRRSLYAQTAMMASEPSSQCATRRKELEGVADTMKVVETTRFPLHYRGFRTLSHWSRRIAKDELMVGLVGAGYYTALTLGAFADLGYYKVNWTMAEQMSWGNKAGCEFLNDKCVKEGSTKFPDMFCTTESTEGPESLQCTSDRQSLGSCSITTTTDGNPLPEQFQYFSENKKVGSRPPQIMDYCPFIMALPQKSCTDGDQSKMPGSVIAANSRCVQGENLKAKNAAVGAVCVEVSCKFNKVIVRYSGNDNWYSCPEGKNLTVNGDVLNGKIVCPKYADVCNTINKTLDESQGPATDPDIVEAIQTSLPEAETTETTKPSERAGAGNSGGTNENVTGPVVENEASTTMESNPSETKEEGNTSSVSGQNNKTTAKKGTDGTFKASSFASVMFVFLILSVIMVP
ncbi:surface protease GP63 [Trypanosoma theileri]|uniref:Leishmanolysin-like peptidase n=1 Tax=Trypanosoma theileri TaxID=67003 RepID=A0A1X0NGV8_9TRYP|nr:surface protease GP63 [Trypanosoma theileri]ORC83907.1 surface protease GP63 [Trypanosoma theileri]